MFSKDFDSELLPALTRRSREKLSRYIIDLDVRMDDSRLDHGLGHRGHPLCASASIPENFSSANRHLNSLMRIIRLKQSVS